MTDESSPLSDLPDPGADIFCSLDPESSCDPTTGLPRLEACLGLLRTATAGGKQAFEACTLAATILLRLGCDPARALKFASKASFMRPQDEAARQLVKECTRELEHEGRFRDLRLSESTCNIQPQEQAPHLDNHPQKDQHSSVPQAVTHLLELLDDDSGGQDADVEDLMSQLCKVRTDDCLICITH